MMYKMQCVRAVIIFLFMIWHTHARNLASDRVSAKLQSKTMYFMDQDDSSKQDTNLRSSFQHSQAFHRIVGHKQHYHSSENHEVANFGRPMMDPALQVRRSTSKKKCISNFCEGADNYPEQDIIKALRNTTTYGNYFETSASQDIVPASFDNRDNFENEESMCTIEVHTMFPQTAKNIQNQTRTLVNVNGSMQLIYIEECRKNVACKFSENFPVGYKSTCKQKYARKRMLVFDPKRPKGEENVFDTFDIPSCCVCTIKRVDD